MTTTKRQLQENIQVIDTGISLCVLISNCMHLTQVFQVEKDVKIKAFKNKDLKKGVS